MIIEEIKIEPPPHQIVRQFAVLKNRTFLLLCQAQTNSESSLYILSHLTEEGQVLYRREFKSRVERFLLIKEQ